MYKKTHTQDIGSNDGLKLSYQPNFNMVMVVVIIFNMHSNQLIKKKNQCVHNFDNLWGLSKDLISIDQNVSTRKMIN